MQWEHITALALFAFVSTFTPGPNNLMLMTSGANVGFNRSIPHMLGITIGFPVMVILVGFGLVELFERYPMVHQVLKVVSLTYLFYLAYRIARSQPPQGGEVNYQPLSFLKAASFQWVNPKGWSMALTAVTVYNPENSLFGLALIAVIYAIANIPSGSFWIVAGKQLQYFLTSNTRIRLFNYTMAALLIVSTLPMI
ncbi:LysE family translocator [Vibrio sp. 404]|uniref:LysE family translocator n=1 Tax=Vibrio marinisediminis TaxID=2758441 RepID=A0A7W2IS66_9VIBR|nr:LysE family translocator [Vibrio marinisediminis]MBA5761020.1 LysE family translocator [Vibrio marinisediminis]